VTRCYYLEVAPVESCDLVQVKPLGKRDYAGIDSLQPQGRTAPPLPTKMSTGHRRRGHGTR
jgi:hypothetical protein